MKILESYQLEAVIGGGLHGGPGGLFGPYHAHGQEYTTSKGINKGPRAPYDKTIVWVGGQGWAQ